MQIQEYLLPTLNKEQKTSNLPKPKFLVCDWKVENYFKNVVKRVCTGVCG